jgi:hypothetical protein
MATLTDSHNPTVDLSQMGTARFTNANIRAQHRGMLFDSTLFLRRRLSLDRNTIHGLSFRQATRSAVGNVGV